MALALFIVTFSLLSYLQPVSNQPPGPCSVINLPCTNISFSVSPFLPHATLLAFYSGFLFLLDSGSLWFLFTITTQL